MKNISVLSSLIPEESILRLQEEIRGKVLLRDSEGYEDARKIWNGFFDKYPAIIIQCAGAADVMSSVNFARQHNLNPAVRSGGHSYPGFSSVDDGLVIDLSRMKGLNVDFVNQRVTADAGILLRELDDEAYRFGLAVTGGQVSHTGIAGLTLGGGLGWLARHQGLTIDNLISVDIVLANGTIVRADEKNNKDLFWAIRGGGGNFGIVTSFTYQLHPQSECLTGVVCYSSENLNPIAELLQRIADSAPNEIALAFGFIEEDETSKTLFFTRYVNSDYKKSTFDKGIFKCECVQPVSHDIDIISYPQLQRLIDHTVIHGRRYYARSLMLKNIDANVLTLLKESFQNRPEKGSLLGGLLLGGAITNVARDATAYPHREPGYLITILAGWDDVENDKKNVEWAKSSYDLLSPFAEDAVYVNELTDDGASRMISAYGHEHLIRLAELKKKFDPDNLFRLNQNIKPIE